MIRRTKYKNAAHLKSISIIILFLLSTILLTGGIIYGLYRVTMLDKRLYAILFFTVASVLFVYLIVRLVKRNVLSRVLLRIAWVFIVVITVLLIISAVVLYGSLIVWRPVIGAAVAPPLIFITLFLLPKLNIFSKIKKYFS